MAQKKIPDGNHKPNKILSENEGINTNLKLICENNGGKIVFKSRDGGGSGKQVLE